LIVCLTSTLNTFFSESTWTIFDPRSNYTYKDS
jgi:hypothetical protein